MIRLRPAAERGHAEHGWLDSWHTFSFADYYDPRHMGYSVLRVINDDTVAPGEGFGTHPHRDMEIISWVLEGELAHKDSMGNGSTIRPRDVQRMSAGTGVTHSEFNPSRTHRTRFLQIWILPDRRGYAPGYAQQSVAAADLHGAFRLLASPEGRDGSISIHQDACLYVAHLHGDDSVSHALSTGRRAYVHVARGGVRMNDIHLHGGDGAYIEQESQLTFDRADGAEILLFDLP